MTRRKLLVGLAVATLAPIAAAGQPASSRTSINPAAVDMDYVKQVMSLSSLSLVLSRMAAGDKVNVPRIRQFAQLELEEQQTVADVWTSLQSDEVRAEVTPLPDAEASDKLMPAGRQEVEKLRAAEAGAAFTREYFLVEVAVHQQLLRLHEEYLKSGKTPRYLTVCKLADALVREHIQLLADIKAAAGSGNLAAQPPL